MTRLLHRVPLNEDTMRIIAALYNAGDFSVSLYRDEDTILITTEFEHAFMEQKNNG